MKRLIFVLFTALAPLVCAPHARGQASSFPVANAARAFHPLEKRNWRAAATRALSCLVWYPSTSADAPAPHTIGQPGHEIFVGYPRVGKASLAPGLHPLILLSHGTGGSAASLDWIGARLAARGYIVLGVNHPGDNALEPLTAAGLMLWWERARDLSDALTAILADREFGPHVDPRRIGAVGFSLGGYTVLELAGARTDRDAFLSFCRSPQADATCRPPEADALGPHGLDERSVGSEQSNAASLAQSGADYRDRRIRAIYAIAPALGEAFDGKGLSGIDIPVAITAGDGDAIAPIATNARRFAALIPGASLALLSGGVGHYTFLDPCTRAALDRMSVLCRDAPGIDRAEIHERVAKDAAAFFAQHLP